MRSATLQVRSFVPIGTIVFTAALAAVLAAITWATLRAPTFAVATVYVAGFLAVAWTRPHLALLLMFAGAPFQNDLSGGGGTKFSIAELNLCLTFLILLIQTTVRKQKLSLGPLAIPIAAYLGICVFSGFQHWRGSVALNSILQMVLYLVVCVILVASLAHDDRALLSALEGVVVTGVLLSLVALATRSNYFFGLHKNGLGASLSCAVVISAELWFAARTLRRKRLLTLGFLVNAAGLLLSLSRGAWLAAIAGILVAIVLRRDWKLLISAVLLIIPVVALAWTLVPQESRSNVTDFHQDQFSSVGARLLSIEYAQGEFEKNRIYGVGVGLRKEYDSTNIVWLILAETGITGLVAFLAIHVVLFWMIGVALRAIDSADPRFSFLVIAAALILGKLVHGCLDHYWSRGPVTIAWGAAGMAVGTYMNARARLHSREAGA